MPARPRPAPVSPGAPRGAVVDRAGRTRISLRLPPRLALVVDGQPIVNDGGGPFVVEGDDVRTPTIVTDDVLRPATLTVGAHVVRYLHRRPRPPSSNDQPMPYVREDIAGLVLETARQALAARGRGRLPARRAADAGRGAAAPRSGAAARRRDPGVRPDLPHLPLRSPAQVPPHGDRARGLRDGRRRRGPRARGAGRSRSRGGRPGGLPDGRLHARRVPATSNISASCCRRSTSCPRSTS